MQRAWPAWTHSEWLSHTHPMLAGCRRMHRLDAWAISGRAAGCTVAWAVALAVEAGGRPRCSGLGEAEDIGVAALQGHTQRLQVEMKAATDGSPGAVNVAAASGARGGTSVRVQLGGGAAAARGAGSQGVAGGAVVGGHFREHGLAHRHLPAQQSDVAQAGPGDRGERWRSTRSRRGGQRQHHDAGVAARVGVAAQGGIDGQQAAGVGAGLRDGVGGWVAGWVGARGWTSLHSAAQGMYMRQAAPPETRATELDSPAVGRRRP